jgi:hypothetical protein
MKKTFMNLRLMISGPPVGLLLPGGAVVAYPFRGAAQISGMGNLEPCHRPRLKRA